MTPFRFASLLPFGKWYGHELQEGINRFVEEESRGGDFFEFSSNHAGIIKLQAQQSVQGVITFTVPKNLREWIRVRELKAINVSATSDEYEVPSVLNDDWRAGADAAQELIQNGATSLLYYCEAAPGPGFRSRRLEGAKSVCDESGVPFTHWKTNIMTDDISERETQRQSVLSELLAQRGSPAAVLTSSASAAATVTRAAAMLGWQLGRELALMHLCDYREYRGQSVQGISAIRLDWRLVGYRAAKSIFNWVEHGIEPPMVQKVAPLPAELTTSSDASYGRDLVTRVRSLLRHSKDYGITVREIATRLSVDPSTLHRNWRSAFDHSLHDELVTRKINFAKSLLYDTDLPIAEVAPRCGYGSQCHFTAAFRNQEGLSPAQWRRQKNR